jgi:hypothetical protein
MTVKILEGIVNEHKEGKRTQSDYETRIHSQSNLLNNNLKGIKPLVEKLFTEAYSRFTSSDNSNVELQVKTEKVLDIAGNQVELQM